MNKFLSCTCGEKYRAEVYAILRAVTGFIFLYHGWAKVFGEGGVAGVGVWFAGMGVPLAELAAFLVSYGELLGGIALILGFLTHWVAKLNIVIMLGAVVLVHGANGFNIMEGGYEYAILLILVNALFMVQGSGKYSLDAKRRNKMVAHSAE